MPHCRRHQGGETCIVPPMPLLYSIFLCFKQKRSSHERVLAVLPWLSVSEIALLHTNFSKDAVANVICSAISAKKLFHCLTLQSRFWILMPWSVFGAFEPVLFLVLSSRTVPKPKAEPAEVCSLSPEGGTVSSHLAQLQAAIGQSCNLLLVPKKHADRRLLFLLDLHLIQASRS